MQHLVRIILVLFLALGTARAQEPVPLLSQDGGAEALATLVDVPWEELAGARAEDFPELVAHWSRIGTAFGDYSTQMAQGKPVMKEWAVVAPRMLSVGSLLGRSGDALIATLPEEDPSRAVRAEGLDQIRTGLERMVQGCLMVLMDMPQDIRAPFVNDLGESLPGILAQLEPGRAIALKAQALGAATLLPPDEAAVLRGVVGEVGEDPPQPELAVGAPERLLTALTVAGWPGALNNGWGEAVLDVNWASHTTNPEAQKADAYALLLAGHGWFAALGEERVTSLDTPAALLDGALRAGAGVLAADVPLADEPMLRRSLAELTVRGTAAAAHYSPKEREPLVEALEARLPGLLSALPEEEAGALHANLAGVADKKLAKRLGL